MNPITINVQVQLGLNKELYDLLKPIADGFSNQPAQPKKSTRTKQAPAAAVESKPEATAEAAQTVADAPADASSAQKEYTAEDIRSAMDRTRRRIEGEDYKDKTDSFGYVTWHRRLTAYFKETAALCGADKPSALPDSASREKFIDFCDRVRIENDDLTDCPY